MILGSTNNDAASRRWPRNVAEMCVLLRVTSLLAALRLLIPRLGLNTLLRWLSPRTMPAQQNDHLLQNAARYTDAVLARCRFPLPGTCLPRALVLYYFARRLGYEVTFCCGVQRRGEVLSGHAWLTYEGKPFLEQINPERQFAITFHFPA